MRQAGHAYQTGCRHAVPSRQAKLAGRSSRMQQLEAGPYSVFVHINATIMAEPDDQETCPLCPPSGPPAYSAKPITDAQEASSSSTPVPVNDNDNDHDIDDDISWISCSKCSTWFHGVCILLSGDENKSTVPAPVLSYVAEQHRAEWTNWTGWVGRW